MSAAVDPLGFPLADALGGGTYRAVELLRGRGAERLERYLISVTWGGDLASPRLAGSLTRSVPGLSEPVFVGGFDRLGVDRVRDAERADHTALVERLPPADPLASCSRIRDPRPPDSASRSGAS